jgi:hypothetical protein
LPMTIWVAAQLDGEAAGIALVAEILPFPGPDHERERQCLAAELAGKKPTLRAFPSAQLVETGATTARVWLGETGQGLKVFAFICAIQPINDAMDRLLARELAVMPTVVVPSIPNMVLNINPDQVLR